MATYIIPLSGNAYTILNSQRFFLVAQFEESTVKKMFEGVGALKKTNGVLSVSDDDSKRGVEE